MRGAKPKPDALRQRRNKKIIATLRAVNSERVQFVHLKPTTRDWHEMTMAWWKDVWASPMAAEFLESDRHGLFRLAVLVDEYWKGDIERAAEIRLQSQQFGLSPLDRRRLQWEVERAESAAKKRPARRQAEDADPRQMLQVVK